MNDRYELTDGDHDDGIEASGLRAMISTEEIHPGPGEVYWQNLLVRTNRRIDEVSSGKALSISWALRVAIPGVVAIISFLIGLHYYAPERPSKGTSVEAVVLGLPAEVQDSLLATLPLSDRLAALSTSGDYFDVSREQIAGYMIDNGTTSMLLETLTDDQVENLLISLGEQQVEQVTQEKI
jgi:hypothetical protein